MLFFMQYDVFGGLECFCFVLYEILKKERNKILIASIANYMYIEPLTVSIACSFVYTQKQFPICTLLISSHSYYAVLVQCNVTSCLITVVIDYGYQQAFDIQLF